VSVPSSELGPPTPSPAVSVYPPLNQRRGEHTRLRVRGWGVSIRTTGKKPSLHFAGESGFESGSEMFISVPDRIRIRPKVSDSYGSSFGSGSATLFFKPKTYLGCSSRFLDPGSGVFAILDLDTVSGSRKNTRSRIRICNTAF
jgi:hypothetical protein